MKVRKITVNIKRLDKLIHRISVIYIGLPFLIFVIGWMKWYFAIPVVVLVGFALWQFMNKNNAVHCEGLSRGNLALIVGIVAIAFLWVYLSGIGGLVYQNSDHGARNSIFRILVNENWPVKFENSDGTTRSLIYYIAFWLPSSIVGKLLGIQAGFCFQALWAALGICLVFYFLFVIFKKVSIWPVIFLIFFSGLDCVGGWLMGNVYKFFDHLEWWANPYQYSSFTTQLFWVFNQALPVWLIVLMMYVQKKNRYMVLLLALSMLSSTLPFVGGIPFCIFFIIRNIRESAKSETGIRWIRELLSFANIVGGGLVGIISFGYLAGNQSGNNLASSSQAISSNDYDASLMIYILFIILEVGLYLLLIYKDQKKNPLFYLTTVCLLIIPLFRVGYGNDFCMRASIPALLMLMIMCMESFTRAVYGRLYRKKYLYIGAFSIILLLGAVTPLHEINRAMNKTVYYERNEKDTWAQESSSENILNSANFSGDIDNNIFYKYFCK